MAFSAAAAAFCGATFFDVVSPTLADVASGGDKGAVQSESAAGAAAVDGSKRGEATGVEDCELTLSLCRRSLSPSDGLLFGLEPEPVGAASRWLVSTWSPDFRRMRSEGRATKATILPPAVLGMITGVPAGTVRPLQWSKLALQNGAQEAWCALISHACL